MSVAAVPVLAFGGWAGEADDARTPASARRSLQAHQGSLWFLFLFGPNILSFETSKLLETRIKPRAKPNLAGAIVPSPPGLSPGLVQPAVSSPM